MFKFRSICKIFSNSFFKTRQGRRQILSEALKAMRANETAEKGIVHGSIFQTFP